MAERKPNRRSSIYLGSDGWWHGWVTVGVKDDGSPDRRHRKGRAEAEVTRKVQELEAQRDTGRVAKPGTSLTVGQWMETWLTTVAARRVRRSTWDTTYAPKVRNRIMPGLGRHRLDRLTPSTSNASTPNSKLTAWRRPPCCRSTGSCPARSRSRSSAAM